MNISLADYSPWLEWITTQKERMISLVTTWSAISSHSYDPAGLAIMAGSLRAAFSPFAPTIETFSLDPQATYSDDGRIIYRPLGSAVSFRKHIANTPSVLLSGHFDTVHRKELSFPIVHLTSSLLQGPGLADMKGGLVVALIALEALERSPFADLISWELFCNPDEEIGSTGSYPYMQQRAKHHQCAFVFEPTLPDGRFVSSRMGSANYCLFSKGRAAHVGRDFQKGHNAILPLLPLIQQLTCLNNPEEGIILSIGMIQGGSSINTVPDQASIRFTLRTQTEEQMIRTKHAIQACVATSHDSPFPFSLLELSYRPPKPFNTQQEQLFRSVAHSAQLLSQSMEGCPSGGVCDGNFFAALGLPTLDTMGPIGGNLHTQKEYLDLDSLVPKATLMALLLMQIASGQLSLDPSSNASL